MLGARLAVQRFRRFTARESIHYTNLYSIRVSDILNPKMDGLLLTIINAKDDDWGYPPGFQKPP